MIFNRCFVILFPQDNEEEKFQEELERAKQMSLMGKYTIITFASSCHQI